MATPHDEVIVDGEVIDVSEEHPQLIQRHLGEFRASGLWQTTIMGRGYQTMTSADQFKSLLSPNQRGKGYLIPLFHVGSKTPKKPTAYQTKLDVPNKDADGEDRKYELPPGPPAIDVGWNIPPRDAPIFFTEGIKKRDALWQVFTHCRVIGLQGHSGWHVKSRPDRMRAELEKMIRASSPPQIYLLFDSDVQTNDRVWLGVHRLFHWLDKRNYDVRVVLLPFEDEKVGVDDYIVAHGANKLKALVMLADGEMPPQPPPKDGQSPVKSVQDVEAQTAADLYDSHLAIHEGLMSDAYAVEGWISGWKDAKGRTLPGIVVGQRLLFDDKTRFAYLFDKTDRVYKQITFEKNDENGPALVQRWAKKMVDKGMIFPMPNGSDYGKNVAALKKAHKNRINAIKAATSERRGNAVFKGLKGTPAISTDGFCNPEYHHLLPLAGGKSIDFSRREGKTCPTIETPIEARFTFHSPVHWEAYEKARQNYQHCLPKDMPHFNDFLYQLDDGRDGEWATAVRHLLGYLLHGRNQQFYALLHGEGRNGKGIIMRLMTHLLGEGVFEAESTTFVGKERRHAQHFLYHKNRRIVICDDPAGYVNDSVLLRYAGGSAITGEIKGGAGIVFIPTATLVMVGQADRVNFRLDDDAMRERTLGLTFTKQFFGEEQDNTLEGKIRAEAPQVLVDLARKAHKYHTTGKIGRLQFMLESGGEIMALGNSCAHFAKNTNIFLPIDKGKQCDPKVTEPNLVAHIKRHCKHFELPFADNRGGRLTKALKRLWPSVSTVTESLDDVGRLQVVTGIAFTREVALDPCMTDPKGEIDGGHPEIDYN